MKKLFAVFVFFCLAIFQAGAQSKDEKQLAAAVENLKKAMLDADKQALELITLPQLTYGHSSGKIEDKAAFVDALVSGRSDFITMDLTNQSMVVNGKTAIVRFNLNGETKDNGVPGTAKLGVMLVWQKDHGKWKLLARQAFKLP